VAAARVDSARSFPVEGCEERQHSVFELEFGVAAAELDAGARLDLVNSGGIGLQAVEGRKDFAGFTKWRLLRQGTSAENRSKSRNEEGPGFHGGSVVR
jgi:hypothetical protein